METKRIQCPSCGIILDVRNSKNEAIKIITCPQCKSTLRVKFHGNQIPTEPLDAETFLPQHPQSNTDPQGNDSETRLAKASKVAKTAILSVDGRDFKLGIGTNTIGRKAPTSSATIQIPTNDPYMSRRHAIITVSKTREESIKSVISNDKNKNITMVDGLELSQGDEIILASGNVIIMGKTRITYIEK